MKWLAPLQKTVFRLNSLPDRFYDLLEYRWAQ